MTYRPTIKIPGGGIKMLDMKLKDQIATHEIARHENDGPVCKT